MHSHQPPRVSVVLPAWNREASIRAAVNSVLSQTFVDFELLVVDDGSTDNTMAMLDDIADPRLRRLSRTGNGGASAARNIGIRAAIGDWVAFQDSDDEWLPQKLEMQIARLDASGPEVVVCYTGMVIVGQSDPQGKAGRTTVKYIPGPEIPVLEGELHETLLGQSFISTQMFMARRTTLLEIDGFDETLPSLVDWDCLIRLSLRGHFLFVDQPMVLQRFSDNSLTKSRGKRLQSRIRILGKHQQSLAAHPRLLARHHVAIAGEQRRTGDMPAARASLMAAIKECPFSIAAWSRLIGLLGLSLLPRSFSIRER
jgi:glycosyltransferase involved in cell wall biosynthesis